MPKVTTDDTVIVIYAEPKGYLTKKQAEEWDALYTITQPKEGAKRQYCIKSERTGEIRETDYISEAITWAQNREF